MVILALLALISGVAIGLSGMDFSFLDWLIAHKEIPLYILMFSVGVSIGLHQGIAEKIRKYRWKVFIIPFGIVLGSFLGGIVSSFVTGSTIREGLACAMGMGWYSLSGITVSAEAGAELGSIAFLSNLMRELFSFFSIPIIARKFNYMSCIGPAGCTSEDTTLPMMMRYTDEETVVLSVMNGIICSALVPLLISIALALPF